MIEEDHLSTGITLFILKEGRTTIGSNVDDGFGDPPDVILRGSLIVRKHCVIDLHEGCAKVIPQRSGFCHLNGQITSQPTELKHGNLNITYWTVLFPTSYKTSIYSLNHFKKPTIPCVGLEYMQQFQHIVLLFIIQCLS